jgi:SAM-dependent methyltransferase
VRLPRVASVPSGARVLSGRRRRLPQRSLHRSTRSPAHRSRRLAATCPLCGADPAQRPEPGEGRHHACAACGLTFLDPALLPSPAAERAHYATHENDPHDPRYRAFLERLAGPLAERLPAGAEGLDYGCGPGPTLHLLMAERGFTTRPYDPFFLPDGGALERSYDFITCSEVVEHFAAPAREFERLHGLLRPGGWLGVMTEELHDGLDFRQWRYARDPTHVAFYRRRTMEWIAARHGWRLHAPRANVFLFQKRPTPNPE